MRIIAGRFRGRPLKAPRGMTTRPTTDRVREALFSILGDVSGLEVLDCYAGTGALGFEALSRGAAHASMIEIDRGALKAIEHNAKMLQVEDRHSLLRCPVEKAVSVVLRRGQVDLILSDAPWPIADEAATHTARLAQKALTPRGTMVLGHPAARPVELDEALGFSLLMRRRWGDSGLSWYSRATMNVQTT